MPRGEHEIEILSLLTLIIGLVIGIIHGLGIGSKISDPLQRGFRSNSIFNSPCNATKGEAGNRFEETALKIPLSKGITSHHIRPNNSTQHYAHKYMPKPSELLWIMSVDEKTGKHN